MKTPFSILFASTALAFGLGLPALAGMHVSGNATEICASGVCAMKFGDDVQTAPLIRVSGDDEDHADGGRTRKGHDDDDDGCEDDDDGVCLNTSGGGNAAPAGTVAPPANGLFGNGAPPVAVTN